MSCQNCGASAQGQYCAACAEMEAVESYYGVPEDNIDNEDDGLRTDGGQGVAVGGDSS